MVSPHYMITIDEVRTRADREHFLCQECSNVGWNTLIFVTGAAGIPLLLRAARKYIPVPTNYSVAFGAITSIIISYYAGNHIMRKCEEKVNRQLDEKLKA